MKSLLTTLCLVLLCQFVYAQRIKTDKFEYKYIKLPLNPLDKSIKNYQSFVTSSYDAENTRLKNEYEAEKQKAEDDYQREMAEYPAKVKEADEKYERDMAEWKKKSLVDKFVEKRILEENNKPQKQVVNKPYKRFVQEPALKKSYDYAPLANTYLQLEGFENNPNNAVQIIATLNGFEYTSPKQVSEVKKEMIASNGTVNSVNVTYYNIEFTYRHTMSVKAVGPDGRELFNITPQELNSYKVYKSPQTKTSQQINELQLKSMFEEKVLQENLTLLSDLVNDRIGYRRQPRNAALDYVNDKKVDYSDLLLAYNEGLSGLMTIAIDEESAKVKISKATELWNKALKESNLNDKKARIDKDVTMSLYFNLLECHFASRNLEEADKVLSAMGMVQMSNQDRKNKEKYDELFIDLRKRVLTNK